MSGIIKEVLFVRREWTEGNDSTFIQKVNEIVQTRTVSGIQWLMSGTQPVGAILHCLDNKGEVDAIITVGDGPKSSDDAGEVFDPNPVRKTLTQTAEEIAAEQQLEDWEE